MAKLSKRLVRAALFASTTSLVGSYALSTLAQIPVFAPPPAGPPTSSEADPAAAVPASEADPTAVVPSPEIDRAAATPTPVAPAAPGPGLLSSRTPPAKSDVITKPGRAQHEDEAQVGTADERPLPRRKWYGWQTLTADGASFAALTVAAVLSDRAARGSDEKGVSSNAKGLVWFGLLGYELAPGIVHFLHRNPGRGFASMGLRLGMPLAGFFLGASAASSCSSLACEESGAGLGVLLGMAGAIAIDAAVLAYDDPKKQSPRGLSLTPLVAVAPHQAWLGLGGEL